MYCKFRHALQNFDGHIDKKMISDFFSQNHLILRIELLNI